MSRQLATGRILLLVFTWMIGFPGVLRIAAADLPACPATQETQVLLSSTDWRPSPGSALHRFCLYGIEEPNIFWPFTLQVIRDAESPLLETLSYPTRSEGLGMFSRRELGDKPPTPEAIDVNFDGYLDVSLLAFVGGTGNAGANYWVFHPEQKRYLFNDVLSGHSLVIDKKRQTLCSGWQGGHAGAIYDRMTFRWIDGTATLTHRESSTWSPDRGCYEHRVLSWQQNRLLESERTCSKVPQSSVD